MKSQHLLTAALVLMLLTACAKKPSVNGCSFTASAAFLDCVADEWEAGVHGECTKGVIEDWEVCVE